MKNLGVKQFLLFAVFFIFSIFYHHISLAQNIPVKSVVFHFDPNPNPNGHGNPNGEPGENGHHRPYCGDGNLDSGEECDDGNSLDGDGCSTNCTKEPQRPRCGNGILESGEECDDGNLISGDGCDKYCESEVGESQVCGNGVLESGEACDDGNNLDGDGCSSLCETEVCGDGVVNAGEGCDDGNVVDGDGCNSLCLLESCGDGIVQSDLGEECESGVTILPDHYSCGTTCLFEVEPYCGDGNLDSGEECDDGNGTPNDGCDADCELEGSCDEDSIQVCGSDVGECSQGTLVCEEDLEWSTNCEGEETSTDEVCDGLDNDCDFVVDDNLQEACSNSCGDAGVMVCTNGEWSDCSAAETNCDSLSLPPPDATPVQDENDNSCQLLGISSLADLPAMNTLNSLAFGQGETVTVTTDDGVLVDLVPSMDENGIYTGFVTVQNCLTASADAIFQGESTCSLNMKTSTPISSWIAFILLAFASLSPRAVYHFIKR